MNEGTLIILLFAAMAYGPWLVEEVIREIKLRHAHYYGTH